MKEYVEGGLVLVDSRVVSGASETGGTREEEEWCLASDIAEASPATDRSFCAGEHVRKLESSAAFTCSRTKLACVMEVRR